MIVDLASQLKICSIFFKKNCLQFSLCRTKIRFFQQKSQDLEPFTFIITVNFNSTCHTPKSIFFSLKTSGISWFSSDSDCRFYFAVQETFLKSRNYLYLINYSSCKFQNFGRNNSKIRISLRMFFILILFLLLHHFERKRIFLRSRETSIFVVLRLCFLRNE